MLAHRERVGISVKDAWFEFLSGTIFSLCYVTGDELLHYFISICSRFPYRYLSYIHFKSRGWLLRSGIQFGADFLLYQSHPIISHSSFALTVIPTALESLNSPINSESCSILNAYLSSEQKCKTVDDLNYHLSLQKLKSNYTWSEILALTRLQSQVNKKLLLCYVAVIGVTDIMPISNGFTICRHGCYNNSYTQNINLQVGCVEVEDFLCRSLVQEIKMDRWKPIRLKK